ncbi:Cache 3/Cache 2 fusion domain-containing protein [Xanthomonas sp. AM6]|uniref:Cache 3/Cache 2 fusion domain-containing protein n=1 Tax=Xanthomonas sp. AM6 TaxID=2982531 RepID=UPI0021DB61E0|nr:Cache 3/Cache 2 fusion domain-containing protein [Xanthomonas sp. AM6]UYB54182.1 Cache 3/Cache 2 fusion domain-containing protein [Xanthomonas sp. AM6]
MLRHSLRVRLLLPVLALVLIVVVVLTLVLAVSEAERVKRDAGASIVRQQSALQSLLAVTRSIMLERVQGSMRLLRQQGAALGEPSVGVQVDVAGRPAPDLLFGSHSQAGNHALVDGVTSTLDGTATIFSRAGDDYVRISTNVTNAQGGRAVGTVLDPRGQVIGRIRKGESFYGVVDILGTPYVTGYEPIVPGPAGEPIGIWYVGYKTDLQALDKVIGAAHVLDSGFIALFDSTGKLRFQSKTGATTDPAAIERIVAQRPADWVVTREEVPGWGFTLVSAYPKSDVDRVIVRQSLWIGGIGLLVCALLLGLQWMLIWTRVLRPIQNLTTVAEELSLGKWNHSIGEVALKDEIGTLARAIARLSNSVRLAMERLSKR